MENWALCWRGRELAHLRMRKSGSFDWKGVEGEARHEAREEWRMGREERRQGARMGSRLNLRVEFIVSLGVELRTELRLNQDGQAMVLPALAPSLSTHTCTPPPHCTGWPLPLPCCDA